MNIRSIGSKLLLVIIIVLFVLNVPFSAPSSKVPMDPATETSSDPSTGAQIVQTYGQLPMAFEANQGQTDSQVKFLSRGHGYSLFLTPDGATLALRKSGEVKTGETESSLPGEQAVFQMNLVGANLQSRVSGQDELPGKVNYFIGNDPSKWRTNVPTFAKVKYEDVYPGIDLVYYGNQGQLEYDFVVAPGSDPASINLGIEGIDKLAVNSQGELVLDIADEQIVMRKPLVYQEVNGSKKEIAGDYILRDPGQVGFKAMAYDTSQPLIIDPVLVFSTYLGGSFHDWPNSIVVDDAGNAYITGISASEDFPTTFGVFQPNLNSSGDAFVTKLDPTGSALVYSTYLGGGGREPGYDSEIAMDVSGNLYITGLTDSPDFPTYNAFQPIYGGNQDSFVTKLNPTGSALVYSTYLGGSGRDIGKSIAVNANGNAYVTGETASSDFPLQSPFQISFGGGNSDAFVTKFSTDGAALVYSTFLGGNCGSRQFFNEPGEGIAVDTDGNAYITGHTCSLNFPTVNPLQPLHGDGIPDHWDAFVTKLNPNGSELIYSTYLGGSEWDLGYSIAVDSEGNAYITGQTFSTDFPTTVNAFQPNKIIHEDTIPAGFVTKLNSTGSMLVYSTYLGGYNWEQIDDIAVDLTGHAYVTGSTFIYDGPPVFPIKNPIQANWGGCEYEAFVTKFSVDGRTLVYSTYLGGNGCSDFGESIAVDYSGNAYITGSTDSSDFPTVNAYQPTTLTDRQTGFVTKLSLAESTPEGAGIIIQPVDTMTGDRPATITFSSVTQAGTTSLTTSSNGPTPPSGFSLGDPPTYYDITTTAIYDPPITVCFTYNPAQYTDPANLHLFHFENETWVDVTTSNGPTNHIICGEVQGLSIFAILEGSSNQSPSVDAGGPYSVDEGSSVEVSATGSDPDGDPLDFAWDLDNNGSFETPGQGVIFSAIGLDGYSTQVIAVQVCDNKGACATDQATVEIQNASPSVGEITAPTVPIIVNTVISAGADFTDPGTLDTHTAVWDWDDGTLSDGLITETNGSGVGSGTHSYTTPGVYTIGLTVTDDDGGVGSAIYRYIVVYDPNGGFVTGGGWILSPEGAYPADPTLTGRANFGFVAKYQKGKTIPDGNTEFQFKLADLNFHSDTYDWLVVPGAKAQFKGTGTINGAGSYKFMLTAIDGQINGGGGTDKFRMKIWWEEQNGTEHLVYDNQIGVPDDADPTTVIQGGSIVIHKTK